MLVKQNRSLIAYICLSLITCGIYGFYFTYSIARDMNIMCAGDGKKTGGLIAYILLSIITFGIYNLWWQYQIGNRLQNNAPRYGLSFTENGTTVLLWDLVGIFLCAGCLVLYPAFAELGIAEASFPNVDYNIVGSIIYGIGSIFA